MISPTRTSIEQQLRRCTAGIYHANQLATPTKPQLHRCRWESICAQQLAIPLPDEIIQRTTPALITSQRLIQNHLTVFLIVLALIGTRSISVAHSLRTSSHNTNSRTDTYRRLHIIRIYADHTTSTKPFINCPYHQPFDCGPLPMYTGFPRHQFLQPQHEPACQPSCWDPLSSGADG